MRFSSKKQGRVHDEYIAQSNSSQSSTDESRPSPHAATNNASIVNTKTLSIVILGLDQSGKSSVLARLKGGNNTLP
jgi:GTPase SAR1 family protein